MDEQTARQEAIAFSTGPGQAITYQIGKLQILKFLAEARMRQGNKFNLRTFHDFVWKNGNVPIALQQWEYLGRRLDSPAIGESSFGEDAEISTRDACTTQSSSPRYSSSRRSFALDRKLRRLLRRVKRKLSKWLSRQHVLIFRSINHRRA